MSGLERARRLPVFVDEEQWARAYAAAMRQVEHLYCTGVIEVPHGEVNGTLRTVAVQIASAALRAAAQDSDGDVTELPGVTVSRIDEETIRYRGDITL